MVVRDEPDHRVTSKSLGSCGVVPQRSVKGAQASLAKLDTMTEVLTEPIRRRRALPKWLAGEKPYLLDYLIVVGIFTVIAGVSVMLRTQFSPDSAHYLGMSLWFSGMSREDAVAYVMQQSLNHGYEPNTTPEQLLDWGLVRPRVVLPLLAVPFIWMFGPGGLGVLSTILAGLMFVVMYRVLRTYYGRLPAVATVLLALSSMFLTSFSLGMLTEALSAIWGALTLAIAYRYQRDRRWLWIVLLVVVTALSGFTRQATFIVAGAFAMVWLVSLFSPSQRRNWHFPALAVTGTALVVQVLQTVLFPFSQAGQYMRMTETDSLWGAILATPELVWGIVKQDLSAFALSDPSMIIILMLAFLSIVLFWRRTESHLLVGAMLGVALYNITNGTSTQFRYAVPGLVFYLASIALLLAHMSSKWLNRPNAPLPLETPKAASQ